MTAAETIKAVATRMKFEQLMKTVATMKMIVTDMHLIVLVMKQTKVFVIVPVKSLCLVKDMMIVASTKMLRGKIMLKKTVFLVCF